MSSRIGILGGSFNPPHLGHLLVAQEAWYRYELARVMLMPAAENPLKPLAEFSPIPEHRLKMVELALGNDGRFALDGHELRRGGKSYTIDSLMRYQDNHPEAELYLLVGSDAAIDLPRWKDIALYRGLCTLVIYNRPGGPDFTAGLPAELNALNLRWEFMPLPQYDISSTDIRKRLRQGKPVRYLAPDAVVDFIHQHRLYQEQR